MSHGLWFDRLSAAAESEDIPISESDTTNVIRLTTNVIRHATNTVM